MSVSASPVVFVPSPQQMLAAPPPGFQGVLSAKARARLEADLAAFRYKPSAAVDNPPSWGEPIGSSFQADEIALRAKLRAERGDEIVISCKVSPCTAYGDFDGDGKRDLVVQVSAKDHKSAGVFFMMSVGPNRFFGFETPELTEAFRSLSSFRVLPAGVDGRKTATLAFASTKVGVAREARLDVAGKFAVSPLR